MYTKTLEHWISALTRFRSYGAHGRIDNIFAIGFSGRKPNRMYSFNVTGSKEAEISTFEALEEILHKLPERCY